MLGNRLSLLLNEKKNTTMSSVRTKEFLNYRNYKLQLKQDNKVHANNLET